MQLRRFHDGGFVSSELMESALIYLRWRCAAMPARGITSFELCECKFPLSAPVMPLDILLLKPDLSSGYQIFMPLPASSDPECVTRKQFIDKEMRRVGWRVTAEGTTPQSKQSTRSRAL